MKNKTESAIARIKRLLYFLSAYSFNLYYMKGKMTFSDLLSTIKVEKSNHHEIIPTSFELQDIL